MARAVVGRVPDLDGRLVAVSSVMDVSLRRRSCTFANPDPLEGVENPLAQPDALRSHLDELVVFDEVEGLLERELTRRHELDCCVLSAAADVGLLLLLGDVDRDVTAATVEAHDHPLVDGGAGTDERLAALLQCQQPVCHGSSALAGGQHTAASALRQRTPPFPPEHARGHYAGAACEREEVAPQSDKSTGWRVVDDADAAGGVRVHRLHLRASRAQGFCDAAEMIRMDVDDALFER